MDCPCGLINVAGIIFLAYTIMAAAYWQDMTRLGNALKLGKSEKEREWIETQIRISVRLFRGCTIAMLFTISLMVAPYYFDDVRVFIFCKYALLVPLMGMIIMTIRYSMGRVWIKYIPKY